MDIKWSHDIEIEHEGLVAKLHIPYDRHDSGKYVPTEFALAIYALHTGNGSIGDEVIIHSYLFNGEDIHGWIEDLLLLNGHNDETIESEMVKWSRYISRYYTKH